VTIAAILTVLAAAWRFADGRGWGGRTTVRNAVGLAIALSCAYVGLGLTWQAGVCAVLAWVSMIAGYTDWPRWEVSVARYAGPTAAIALLASTVAPPAPCVLYAAGGVVVAGIYVLLHRTRDFGWNTAVCEVAAGAVIVGGLSWLSIA